MRRSLLSLLLLLSLSVPGRCDGGDIAAWFDGLDTTTFILVDKQKLTLSLIGPQGQIEHSWRVACGVNYGNKTKKGDYRTPEGRFPINQLLNAAGLTHDFGDGKGPVANAYGPWFLRLDVPGFITIGIHGTHLPESIGTRATEGCIRMRNEDILELKERVAVGMPVVILPDTLSTPVSTFLSRLAPDEVIEEPEEAEPIPMEMEPCEQPELKSGHRTWIWAILAAATGLAAGFAAVRIFKKKRNADL